MAKGKGLRLQRKRRARLEHRRPQTVGTLPGSVEPAKDACPTSVHLWAFTPEAIQEQPLSALDSITQHKNKTGVRWVDVAGTADADALRHIGEVFGLHPLALEDVVNGNQRPKLEEFASHLFLVVKMPVHHVEPLVFEQLAIFIGPDFLITIQEDPGDCFDPVRLRLRQAMGRIRQMGPDYLAYALIDAVIDSFFPLLEEYSDRLEELESRVLSARTHGIAADVHAIRHDLRMIRRVLWSTREVLNALTRDQHGLVQSPTRPFFRDCHDHTVQLLDIVEGAQDLATSLADLHMSALSARMNEIMKVLTMIATLFIPLSFIASVYGMNFNTEKSPLNMPELSWRYGYPFALGLMAITVVIFLIYFGRKGWLTADESGVLPHDDPTS